MREQAWVIFAEAELRKGDGTPVFDENGSPVLDENGKQKRKNDGTLIVRHVSISPPPMPDPPRPPACVSDDCIKQFNRELDAYHKECKRLMNEYKKVQDYHTKRVMYAQKARDDDSVPDWIKLGSWSPKTGAEADIEVAKLDKKIKDITRRR
jgi:hypothetical protein